ncbi:MAG: D-alanyl-D-alanine carboxypeptidase/D-alanyl-D-alanine-endopeptidase [Altererythrobacter sp.]|nr:D-alanyl-D-alanine carboxypeptidase/D-alanyl-D-alanine-endopeptidase [Altererythrobacter sp.]
MRLLIAAALAFAAMPAAAQTAAVADPVSAILAEAGPGTRWGVVVADAEGREILAINPEGRFMPASNTKLFTTAAALWAEARGELAPLDDHGAAVRIEGGGDVVLIGRGDARLSGRADCLARCLAALADGIAAKTRHVRDVIGDATLFPDQRWSPGMSWNNIPSSSGTGVAALSIDDNEIAATVAPGAIGAPPVVVVPAYYTVRNMAVTVAGDGDTLAYDRAPNGRELVVSGTFGLARAPVVWRLGVDDPADYAAWQLAGMLRARGVRVKGAARSRYRPLVPREAAPVPVSPAPAPASGPVVPPPVVALPPSEVAVSVVTINKLSQNLHAELLLRRLGLAKSEGSIADGQAVVSAMLAEAGVSANQVTLSDGSGMSSYNRVAPRATVRLLQWSQRQPWGADYRASLPVGGADGTLRRRFAGTPLQGRIFAKTGTLNATNALAGWMIAASGKVLTFAIYANDVPEDVRATAIMDRALLALAAAN